MDDKLATSNLHVTALSGVFDGVLTFLERLHVAEALADVYAEWPEIKEDIEALIEDVLGLIGKLRRL